MATSYQPHRRRLLAGLAVIGLLPLRTAINASAQESLPKCKRTGLSGKRSKFTSSLKYEDGHDTSYAQVKIRPSKIKQRTIRFAPEVTEEYLTLFILRILENATQSNQEYNWNEYSVNLPTMYYASNGKVLKIASVHITIGEKTNLQARYNYVVQQFNIEQRVGDIRRRVRVSSNDVYKQSAWQELTTWLDDKNENGNLAIRISDAVNGPDGLTITYKRKDILRAIKQAEAALDELEKELAASECELISSSSGCFMTTAACEVIGLADDCWELETLRKFRDGWLSAQLGGTADISRYYNTAPDIIQSLNKRPDANKIWLKLYWHYILPSAVLIKLGFHKTAHNHYSAMMKSMRNFL